ncbi:MAG: nitronate monooxygenase, partial [Acidimicrobiia bacterium]|nr:nitronate monooxygenase [Acidimicrobiia bacterium]
MLTTRFTELIGCQIPLQQAGMGVVAGPELAAAVTRAGALGMLGNVLPAPQLAGTLEHLPSPVGVNFLIPFVEQDAVEAAASGARLVEFFYGDPEQKLVDLVHGGGALAAWQVGDAEEARAARDAGCDVIVAQGVEAGGHVRGTIGLLPVLDGVLNAVGDTTVVVAAGGIGTAHAVKAVLAAGAHAARVGTRFVA